MSVERISLPWGRETLDFYLPDGWSLAGVLGPSALPGVKDAVEETARSLAEPIGSLRLADLARPDMKVVLVIDDSSRPTPVAQMLPAVMKELERGGIRPQQVTVIPALGVHRPMQAGEVAARVGDHKLHRMNWESHDCDDPARLVTLGTTSRGTPVLVNKTLAESDLVVSIGCIEPHIIASFGGGYKNLIPGLAGRTTIAHNHALNCSPDTFNMVGQPIEKNPMRLDLEEGAKMLKPPVFIVNAVLNSALKVVRVVSGDPIAAHRSGAAVSAEIYGVRIPRMVDVLIAASFPMDQDLRQGVKALANTIRAMRPGGVMITTVRAEEGVGVFGLANRKLPLGRGALRLVAPLLLPRVSRLKLKGMGEEDRFFLYFALQAMLRGDLLMYAPTIPLEIKDRLPFVSFCESLASALERARQRFPKKAEALVFPQGGMTYPIIEE